jgi:hypothetical protein
MTDVTAQQNPQQSSYVDDYVPPVQTSADQVTEVVSEYAPEPSVAEDAVSTAPQASTAAPVSEAGNSESLEDQNIFDLLGISEATEEEKELFLDELQQVIWEDFVENDVELLLTEDELKEFRAISENSSLSEDDRQGQMIDFLEKLIPDLEKIMLEKALDLKEDMTRQRITELQNHYKDTPERLEVVQQALSLADQQKWRSVATTLNAMMTA